MGTPPYLGGGRLLFALLTPLIGTSRGRVEQSGVGGEKRVGGIGRKRGVCPGLNSVGGGGEEGGNRPRSGACNVTPIPRRTRVFSPSDGLQTCAQPGGIIGDRENVTKNTKEPMSRKLLPPPLAGRLHFAGHTN